MNVMDLMAKIGLDNSEYNKNLGDSESRFKGFGSAVASGAKTVAKVGVAAFAAIGTAIAGATTSLIKNAGETAAYADQIDKMSQKLGFTTDAYQEWDFILQHSGSSIESVKGSLIKLQKAAESGGEAFEQLGINQEEFLAMGSQEQFETAVTALQNVADEEERARLASELFGKSYQELMPLLNTSAEETAAMKEQVHELNGVMSEDAVKAGAAYQDSLTNLKTAFGGLKNNLMGEFLPGLTKVMDGLTALISGDESGVGQLKEGIKDFANTINQVLPQAISLVGSVAEALLEALPDLINTVAEELPGILEKAIPLVINSLVSLADAVVKALPSIMSAIQKNIGVISSGLTRILSAIGKILIQLLPTLLPTLLQIGIQLIQELARGITENASSVIETIFELINTIVEELTNPETLMSLLECGLSILTAIINGIAENLPMLLETMGTLIVNIVTFLVEAIPELVASIGKNGATIITEVLPQIITSIGQAGADLLLNISGIIAGWIPDLISGAKDAFESLGQGILNAWDWIKSKVMDIGTKVLTTIQAALSTIFEVGKNLVQGLWNGINNAKDWVLEKIKGFGTGILDGIKDFFGISSPSKKTAWMGQMLAEGLGVGVEEEAPETFRDIQKTLDDEINGLDLDDISVDTTATVSMRAQRNKAAESQVASIRNLAEQIREFIDNWPDEIINVQIGDQKVEEILISGKNRVTTRSGGQVNV